MSTLLTREDIAKRFQCSKRAVYRLSLPAPVMIGRLTRWREEDIDAWVAGQLSSGKRLGRPRSNRTGV